MNFPCKTLSYFRGIRPAVLYRAITARKTYIFNQLS